MARYTIIHKGTDVPVNYPGVTTITGLIDKSRVLMIWAVRMMVQYICKNWVKFAVEEVKKIIKGGKKAWVEFESEEDFHQLLEDAKNHYNEVSDEAKIIGTSVHDLVNEYIKANLKSVDFDIDSILPVIVEKNGLPESLVPKVVSRFNNTVEWFNENVIEFIETEQPICSKVHGFCGTLDILARLRINDDRDNKIIGGVYIVDLKSSKDFYDGQDQQVAGYRIGRQEGGDFHLTFKNDNDKENIEITETDVKIDPVEIHGIGILTTNYKDTGAVKFKDYTDKISILERAFLKLLDYYYNAKNRRLKNNPFTLKAREEAGYIKW